jgi:hypothetical protein
LTHSFTYKQAPGPTWATCIFSILICAFMTVSFVKPFAFHRKKRASSTLVILAAASIQLILSVY